MPNHFDAMHLLGVVAMQRGHLDDARGLITDAIALNPKFAAAHNNLGNVYLRQGRLDDAQACFERAIKLQPGFGAAHYNLGNQLRRQGRLQDAATHFRRAIAANAKSAQSHTNLGATLLDLGDARGAVKALETAVRLNPDNAEALSNLGLALSSAGEPSRALDALDRALKLDPKSRTAIRNRGTVLARLGRHAEAKQCLEAAVAAEPASAAAHCNLGNILRDSGAAAEALERFQRAIEVDPTMVEARIGLALALSDLGRDDEAQEHGRRVLQEHPDSAAARLYEGTRCLNGDDITGAEAALRDAIALQGSNADAHYQLGNVLMRQLRSREAVDSYERALAADPAHATARWALVMAQIPAIYSDVAEIARSRANFARRLSELDTWFDASRTVDGQKAVGSTQPFYLAYQASSNRELLARYGALCTRLMASWQKEHVPALPPRATGPIRVGIASAQLHEHSVWNAIVKGWVKHLDRTRFELFLFNLGTKSDAVTEQARQWSRRLESGRRPLPQWANAVAGSALDVLIYPEIGMDALTVKLASMRLARVQAAAWGHPETTGLPTIDHYLSAEALEPPNGQDHYSERLVTLPHLGVCYEPLAPTTVAPDLAALGLPLDVPLLLCPGTLFKYSPLQDAMWIEISRLASPCRLVFFRPTDGKVSAPLERRLEQRYAQAGLRYTDCVTFVPTLDRARFFGLMQCAALLLDTPGFSGFNTAMQAIECGLPVVGREGEFMRGRLASSILRRMGMDALVATTDEAYVELAVSLTRDAVRRLRLRDEMVARRGVLFGDLEPVRALERFLKVVARGASA
jgi:predicted O-linked N-acetylglucosamine transferase (SPINDLY family)